MQPSNRDAFEQGCPIAIDELNHHPLGVLVIARKDEYARDERQRANQRKPVACLPIEHHPTITDCSAGTPYPLAGYHYPMRRQPMHADP